MGVPLPLSAAQRTMVEDLAAPEPLSWRDKFFDELIDGDCHIAMGASAKRRRLRNFQAAATAVRHVSIATARSSRCVWAEVR